MPLVLIGKVTKVTLGGREQITKEGEVIKTDPAVYVLNEAAFDDTEAPMKIEKLRCKDNLQAEAFRRFIDKMITVSVNVWTNGADDGLYLSKGVLPRLYSPEAQPTQATPPAQK